MSLIARDELRVLATAHPNHCVSIYMPAHRAGPEVLQNPIRLKNLLGQVEAQLQTRGLQSPAIAGLLAPATNLLEDLLFWQHQRDGLAIFLSTDTLEVFRLPLRFQPLALVAERFHLKPLLPLLSEDGQFYVLTLSQEEMHLYQGTAYTLDEIELQDVPDGLAAFLQDEDRERHLQFHTSTRTPGGRGGDRPAVFHGHGVLESNARTDILQYFRRVDAGLHDVLQGQTAPLVLAAVDHLLPIYHEANTYPHLLAEGIASHPTALSVEELHAQAWAIVEPYFLADRQEAEALYKHYAGTGDVRANQDIARIVAAAYYERVATVFVALGVQQWGTFDPQTQAVTRHDERQAGDQDLLDLAAVHTFLNQGAVYVTPLEDMPADEPVAAIFRY
jgi:hypothetical protein